MKAVADTLEVASNHPVERASRSAKPRGRYCKVDDEPLVALIRYLVDERPSYDYRRITALVNRQQRLNTHRGSMPSGYCGSRR
jgi:putative transposase